MRLFLLSGLLATAAAAQPALQLPAADAGPSLRVEALYALGDDVPITTAASPEPTEQAVGVGAVGLSLGARVPVGGVTVVGEVPLGFVHYDFPEVLPGGFVAEDTGALAVGNPYLGAEARPSAALAVSAGVRLPLVSEPGAWNGQPEGWEGGLIADRERFEAYLPNTLTISAGAAFTAPLGGRARLLARLDPAVLIPTGDASGSGAADVALGGGVGVAAEAGPATLHAGLFARSLPTAGAYGRTDVFGTDGLATAGAAFRVGGVRPAVEVRVPLTETPTGADATVALRLGVPLR